MVYNVYMIRKQLYITPQIDRELAILARQEGKSVAEVVREILGKYLHTKNKENPAAILLKLAENPFKGPKDLSTNLTSYLYGEKSPNYGKRKKVNRRR